MNRKIIGTGIALAILIGLVFVAVEKQESPHTTVVQNLTSPLPIEGKHLQLSINESVGIKSAS